MTGEKKETKRREKRREKKDSQLQITNRQRQSHALYIHYKRNNDDDCGVSRAVVVHRGERFGREILDRGDRRKRRRLVV